MTKGGSGMKTWYKVNTWKMTVDEVTVHHETDKCVFVVSHGSRPYRQDKLSSDGNYYSNRSAAIQDLRARLVDGLQSAREKVSRYESLLKELR